MNFTRPINIVAGERPPTVYDVVNTGECGVSRTDFSKSSVSKEYLMRFGDLEYFQVGGTEDLFELEYTNISYSSVLTIQICVMM